MVCGEVAERLKAAVCKTYQGPINTSRIPPDLAVSGPKSPDRDSVLTCPGLPFADTTTAQFAAQWRGEARAVWLRGKDGTASALNRGGLVAIIIVQLYERKDAHEHRDRHVRDSGRAPR
jgi:hypothetical protein